MQQFCRGARQIFSPAAGVPPGKSRLVIRHQPLVTIGRFGEVGEDFRFCGNCYALTAGWGVDFWPPSCCRGAILPRLSRAEWLFHGKSRPKASPMRLGRCHFVLSKAVVPRWSSDLKDVPYRPRAILPRRGDRGQRRLPRFAARNRPRVVAAGVRSRSTWPRRCARSILAGRLSRMQAHESAVRAPDAPCTPLNSRAGRAERARRYFLTLTSTMWPRRQVPPLAPPFKGGGAVDSVYGDRNIAGRKSA